MGSRWNPDGTPIDVFFQRTTSDDGRPVARTIPEKDAAMQELLKQTSKTSTVKFVRWVHFMDRVAHAPLLSAGDVSSSLLSDLLPEQLVLVFSNLDTETLYDLFATSKWFYRLFILEWHSGLFQQNICEFNVHPRELPAVARELDLFVAFVHQIVTKEFDQPSLDTMNAHLHKEKERRATSRRWEAPWRSIRIGSQTWRGKQTRSVASGKHGIDVVFYTRCASLRLNQSMRNTRDRFNCITHDSTPSSVLDDTSSRVVAHEAEHCHEPITSGSGVLIFVPPDANGKAHLKYKLSGHEFPLATFDMLSDTWRRRSVQIPQQNGVWWRSATPVLFMQSAMAIVINCSSSTSIEFVYSYETRPVNA
jgi:hypothetical protein